MSDTLFTIAFKEDKYHLYDNEFNLIESKFTESYLQWKASQIVYPKSLKWKRIAYAK